MFGHEPGTLRKQTEDTLVTGNGILVDPLEAIRGVPFFERVSLAGIAAKAEGSGQGIQRCFDRSQPLKRMPVFKKRGLNDGIRFPQDFKINNRWIFLPKIGWIGFHKSCDINGRIKNIPITRKGGRRYASIQVEQMIEIRKHPSDSEIGIDAGIKCFAAFSDGTRIECT